ncbi:MAG: MoaD/ThiS family protein [Nanoarchaeota archaeon]
MKIEARIERENKKFKIDVKAGTTAKGLALELGLNPVEVIPAVNEMIVAEDYKIKEKDKVEFLSVVSGG